MRATGRMEEVERLYAATYLAPRSYAQALSIFAALWRHARRLNPDFTVDWRHDVAADVELARVLNGLPRRD